MIKSKHVGNSYQYETDVSIWRPDDYDADDTDSPYIYGITDLYVEGHTLDGYSGWWDPLPTWDHEVFEEVGNIWVHWFSEDRNDPDTWLGSGIDYDFGFTLTLHKSEAAFG